MADIEALYKVFEKFCSFGSSHNISGSFANVSGSPTIDGSKFAKLCRETYIMDQRITPTEVDITFNKVKGNNERKVNFDQFQNALKILAEKKFPKLNPYEAYVNLIRIITKTGSPEVNTKVVPAKSGITERLTDPANYTGTQKAVFGSQSSLASKSRYSSQSSLVQTQATPKRNYNQIATVSTEALAPPKKALNLPKIQPNPQTSSKTNVNVFDRLTNTQSYTGLHKHRFDSNGNGRGLEGRDTAIKGSGTHNIYRGGDVKSISNILRQ